jgi:hypothetical protein
MPLEKTRCVSRFSLGSHNDRQCHGIIGDFLFTLHTSPNEIHGQNKQDWIWFNYGVFARGMSISSPVNNITRLSIRKERRDRATCIDIHIGNAKAR